MTQTDTDLTALLGSRICHDLISPLGAIGNGVELLELSGAAGPEITLIREAVAAANQRIRFFRVAFGATSNGQAMSAKDITAIVNGDDHSKIDVNWPVAGDLPRAEVKLVFLALLCLETALPYGGRIDVALSDGEWRLNAQANRLVCDADLWGRLTQGVPAPAPAAAHLQFALIGPELAARGRQARIECGDNHIQIAF